MNIVVIVLIVPIVAKETPAVSQRWGLTNKLLEPSLTGVQRCKDRDFPANEIKVAEIARKRAKRGYCNARQPFVSIMRFKSSYIPPKRSEYFVTFRP